ncbi:TPA: hypothetical protein N0F65_003617 [Lagenidium giganteum]|uniref:Uncharacterized protein n=1 Tax=Lagenidium giganteum TaxID=4803 RepID=A0AAV2Z022_9STRA|nr:TPA: hypothetical protein N0F65_003617 [Lagenidium giganteum]
MVARVSDASTLCWKHFVRLSWTRCVRPVLRKSMPNESSS